MPYCQSSIRCQRAFLGLFRSKGSDFHRASSYQQSNAQSLYPNKPDQLSWLQEHF